MSATRGIINKVLREAGFDPSKLEDATDPFWFKVPEGGNFRKGLVVGSPTECSAAKACKLDPGVVWAWIGYSRAVLVFRDGRIRRYAHEGVIPSEFDDWHSTPPGTYKLRPPAPSLRTGYIKPKTKRPRGPHPQRGNRASLAFLRWE